MSAMEIQQIKNILESILFVARKPLSGEELFEAIGCDKGLLMQALAELTREYETKGIRIVKVAGGHLMGTNPENADFVKKVLRIKVEARLSPQAIETLSIIAYKQPATMAEIERLRGVNSDWIVDSLIAKKLVKEVGRSEAVGRPYLYGTTTEFLRHFGLENLDSLPPLPSSEAEQELIFKSALKETETIGGV